MKKAIAILTAVLLLFLCSCNKNVRQRTVTSNMLNITNEEKSYLGCRDRLNSVTFAMGSMVGVLEKVHNDEIKLKADSEYFLEDEYILTAFNPFLSGEIAVTDYFDENLDNTLAGEIYASQAKGMDISFKSNATGSYSLRFISEELIKEYSCEYNKDNDSFRYVLSIDDKNGTNVSEFLEFASLPENKYMIQSEKSRCCIDFDEEGNIIFFCCGELAEKNFSSDNSIFPSSESFGDDWVLEEGHDSYLSIHTFKNGVLTHEDRSSGPWKTVEINYEDHASAFYQQ